MLLRRGFSVISFFYLKKREEQVKKGEWCVFLKFEGFPEYFGLKDRKLPFFAIKIIFHLQFDHRLIFLLINPFKLIFFVSLGENLILKFVKCSYFFCLFFIHL